MTTSDSDKRAESTLYRQMTTLGVSIDMLEDEGPSEYTMQAPRRSAYMHHMPQERLNAIAKVVSEATV